MAPAIHNKNLNKIEVSLVYRNLVKVIKENLVKASKKILCSQEKVLVLILDSENFVFTGKGFILNVGFRNFFVFTGEGFSLNLGFRQILCSQEIDSVLFLV